jgi:EpsI family protein
VFEVEGGCSGVHFLMVSLALSTLYGEIGRDTWNVRLKLIALAVALALLTNWLRVYIIIVAGYLTNMQHYLIRKEHYNFGWMVFAVMMVVFFLLARRFKIHERAPVAVAPPASAGNARNLGLAVAVACVIATPAWAFLRSVNPAALPPPVSLTTHTPRGWSQGAESATPDWNPVFVGADNVVRAIYQDPTGRRVQVYLASYAVQAQGKELVSYGNSLIGPADGSIESSSRATSGEVARELVVQSPAGRAVIHYYYLIGGHVTDRGIVAQVWYGLSALRRETAASVFAMRAACLPDCDAARTLLGEFSGNPEKN